jgi:[acyl-carrier-protein] S-malonyltransferase
MEAAARALLFPGQGSHADGMDAAHRGQPVFERGLELLGYDPFERLEEGTRTQQPAVFLCSVAAWDAAGRPEAVAAAGHSLGEYAALVAAGALELEPAVALVDRRAAAMADAALEARGGMVALLGGDRDAVAELADELGLVVANDNAPGQQVLAGPDRAVTAAAERARDAAGAHARRLRVSGAFHSPLMAPAVARLEAALASTPFREPRFPVYSCSSAAPFADPRRELAENVLRPVRWRETLLALRDAGARELRELGPGRVLTGLVKRTVPELVAAR